MGGRGVPGWTLTIHRHAGEDKRKNGGAKPTITGTRIRIAIPEKNKCS
jgi:hypothetical protein